MGWLLPRTPTNTAVYSQLAHLPQEPSGLIRKVMSHLFDPGVPDVLVSQAWQGPGTCPASDGG